MRPSPQPLAPEYRGEGLLKQPLSARANATLLRALNGSMKKAQSNGLGLFLFAFRTGELVADRQRLRARNLLRQGTNARTNDVRLAGRLTFRIRIHDVLLNAILAVVFVQPFLHEIGRAHV